MPSGKYIRTKQHRINLSIALTGHIPSKETKLKLSQSKQGKNNPFYGKKHSLATKQKMKKPRSEEAKQRMSKSKQGNKNAWKGGKIINKGYVYILKSEHPQSDSNGYIAEHRLLLEKYLGRHLTLKERVHHISEKRDDNRIENFMLFPSVYSHLIYHRKIKEITTA